MFYKILHRMVDISLPDFIIPSATAAYTRGHDLRFYLPFSRINAFKYTVSFLQPRTYGMNYLITLHMHPQ